MSWCDQELKVVRCGNCVRECWVSYDEIITFTFDSAIVVSNVVRCRLEGDGSVRCENRVFLHPVFVVDNIIQGAFAEAGTSVFSSPRAMNFGLSNGVMDEKKEGLSQSVDRKVPVS